MTENYIAITEATAAIWFACAIVAMAFALPNLFEAWKDWRQIVALGIGNGRREYAREMIVQQVIRVMVPGFVVIAVSMMYVYPMPRPWGALWVIRISLALSLILLAVDGWYDWMNRMKRERLVARGFDMEEARRDR